MNSSLFFCVCGRKSCLHSSRREHWSFPELILRIRRENDQLLLMKRITYAGVDLMCRPKPKQEQTEKPSWIWVGCVILEVNVKNGRKRIIHKPKPAWMGPPRCPPHQGELAIPEGKEDCLDGLTFVVTGLSKYLTVQEISDLIFDHGGFECKLGHHL